jgi:hypothetical protein
MLFATGYHKVWHNGEVMTFKSYLWLYPQLDLGLYIQGSGNQDGLVDWAMMLILHHITSIVLQEDPWLTADAVCHFPESFFNQSLPSSPPPKDDALPRPVSDFVGIYDHPTFGEMNIEAEDNHLHLAMGKYFRAKLLYDGEEDLFITQMEGSQGYMGIWKAIDYRVNYENEVIEALSLDLSVGSVYANPTWFYRQGAARPDEEREVFNPVRKCPECEEANSCQTVEASIALMLVSQIIFFAALVH